MLARPQAAWEVYRTVGGSVALAMTNDGVGLLAELLINVAYAVCLTSLDRLMEGLSRSVMLDVWCNVVTSLHKQALDGAAFQRVQAHRRQPLENPLQRILEAKALLEELKAQVSSTGGLAIQMLYFLPLLIRGGGGLPVATLCGLYAIHLAVRTHWMPNFKAITAKHSHFEEHFQVAQTRMRHVAEPVAFSGGGDAERLRVEEHFERLCEHRLGSLRQEFAYNFLTEFFLVYDNLPIWFHRMLSFNFAYRHAPAAASPASAVQNYLYDRSISVGLVAVQGLAALPVELARMDARASRLLGLREALASAPRPAAELHSAGRLAAQDLDLLAPGGAALARGLSFELRPGEPLLVTGPNGCGKTALARVLLGLWPPAGPRAAVFAPPDLGLAPQRPYLAPGSLGDQVTYPRSFARADEAPAAAALQAVGLMHLLERAAERGWAFRCAWEDVLSGGEQQRLSLARILFHRPRFALLDECTSMVAADAEERLYRLIQGAGVTPLTFSQRLFLPQLYCQELRLGDDSEAGWCLVCTPGRAAARVEARGAGAATG